MAKSQSPSPHALTTFQFENVRFSVGNCMVHDAHRDQVLFFNRRVQIARTDLHIHKSVEIFGVLKGHIDFTIDGKTIPLSEHDVIVIAPNIPHKAEMETASDYLMLNTRCFFEPLSVDSAIDLYRFFTEELQTSRYFLRRDSSIAADAFERILRCSRQYDQRYFFGAYMYEILLDLYAACCLASSDQMPLTLSSDSERINTLDDLLSEYYMTPCNTEQLAEKLSLSKRQLERFVKKQYGMSLRALITQRRMDVAKTMLVNTDKSIQAIATDVGYATPCCFYNAFKKLTGMTPVQYRHKQRM